MLFDMIKSGHVAASRVIKIIKQNLIKETAEDVISDNLMFIPVILSKYLPEDTYEQHNSDLFNIMFQILKQGTFADSVSAIQLIFSKLIQFAKSEEHSNLIFKMFMEDKALDLEGNEI